MKIYVQPQVEIIASELYLLAAMSLYDEPGDPGVGQLANDAFFDNDNLSSYTNAKVWGKDEE